MVVHKKWHLVLVSSAERSLGSSRCCEQGRCRIYGQQLRLYHTTFSAKKKIMFSNLAGGCMCGHVSRGPFWKCVSAPPDPIPCQSFLDLTAGLASLSLSVNLMPNPTFHTHKLRTHKLHTYGQAPTSYHRLYYVEATPRTVHLLPHGERGRPRERERETAVVEPASYAINLKVKIGARTEVEGKPLSVTPNQGP